MKLDTPLAITLGRYVQYAQGPFVSSEQAALDFFYILRHPFVQAVAFTKENVFGFQTKYIGIPYQKKLYGIGFLFVEMNRKTELSQRVKIINISDSETIGGPQFPPSEWEGIGHVERSHPHAYQSGSMCMSTASASVQQAIQEGRLPAVVDYMANVLPTYNDESNYLDIVHWPTITKDYLERMNGSENTDVDTKTPVTLPGSRLAVSDLRDRLRRLRESRTPDLGQDGGWC